VTTFMSAKEAKRALYEESLRTKVSVRDILRQGDLCKRLRQHPVLADVLAYFAGEGWKKERVDADASCSRSASGARPCCRRRR
jgi:hypothetical protein